MSEPPKNPALPSPGAPQGEGGDAVVLERVTQRVKPPKRHQVVLLNDDFTPMEFVVWVIQEYFSKDQDTATHIMLKIHVEGRGVCGVFSKEVAEAKANQVVKAARRFGHPLQCVTEPVDD